MSDHNEIRLLLELYADGEIEDSDRAEVEARLESDPAAREYLLALKEVSTAVNLPIDMATEAVSFDGLFERVMADLAEAPAQAQARDAELEMLAMAFADGEPLGVDDQARVDAYLAAVPEAREGVEAIRELGELTRLPIELAAESVDFDRLATRIQVAVETEMTAAPAVAREAQPGFFDRLKAFFGEHRGVFVSAAVSAALVAFLVPLLTSKSARVEPTINETVVHNHYYGAYGAESVNYQPGYWGASQPGDMEEGLAPVIWIAAEPVAKIQTPEDQLVPITPRPVEHSL